ncbi:MAG: PAS domain S-box protein, partial [Euryarchaeota archaeon]|nr:PAS domain S-box protein [Euryarchaeota archaeon]
MKYEDKDRKQLINELEKLHQRITELEKSEIEHEKVQESFKRLNYQNKLILESVGEGIYGVDLEGNVTFFNPSAENITGYNAEEVIGKYQHTILHHTKKDGSPYPAEECPVYTTLVDGISRHITDEIFWRKDGTSFPVEYTSAPIKDRGNIIGVVVIFHDVTERKKAEKDIKDSETKYKSIFENTGTATVIVEEDTTISLVNTEFEKLSGYSKEEIEGKKSWTEFVVE